MKSVTIGNPIIVDARIGNIDISVSKDYTLHGYHGYFQYWNNGNYSSKSFPNEFVIKLKSILVDEWKNEMILKTSSEKAEQ